MPSWLIGMIVSADDVYGEWNKKLGDKRNLYATLFLIGITVLNIVIRFVFLIDSNFIHYYVLFEVWALTVMAKRMKKVKILIFLGENSLYMWLVHSIFLFGIIQPITYYFRVPIVIFAFVLAITILLSVFICKLDKKVHSLLGL